MLLETDHKSELKWCSIETNSITATLIIAPK